MKIISRTVFAAYLLILVWLVLFKFSYDPFGVIHNVQTRSVNLMPFARTRTSEIIANFVAFIPFGIMLGVNFRQSALKYKVAAILAFSLALEAIQYALAIGITDITDVITNTAGGISGLALYGALGIYVGRRYLDRAILIAGTLSILAVVYLRVFVFIVRY